MFLGSPETSVVTCPKPALARHGQTQGFCKWTGPWLNTLDPRTKDLALTETALSSCVRNGALLEHGHSQLNPLGGK